MALCLFALLVSLAPLCARAQDDSTTPEQHGRKYKAPPETSRIEVTVLKGFNKKPIMNAAVVFHPVKDGRDEGNMEMKTDPDGKAVIDVIPTGSKVTIQVIADGFATFAQDYQVNEATRQIVITLLRPRAQVSAYIDNSGKPAELEARRAGPGPAHSEDEAVHAVNPLRALFRCARHIAHAQLRVHPLRHHAEAVESRDA